MTSNQSGHDHISLTVRQYGAAPGSHWHDHYQVLVGLTGTLELDIEGRAAQVTAGSALLLSPGVRHDFEAIQGCQCLVLDTTDPAWARQTQRPAHAATVQHLAAYLACAMPQGVAGISTLGSRLLLQSWNPATATARPRRHLDWDALTLWVEHHMAQPLTVADLAKQVHLSESQFQARCHETQGCSPMAWVRSLRLLHAQVLKAQGLSVAETARLAGYQSPSALTAALRRSNST
jgi:AraC-like DNA-binding protein/mannose-6-phosphate isomerase-like protein (cupin superfamily)